jgi:FixJ family two-component response regulator
MDRKKQLLILDKDKDFVDALSERLKSCDQVAAGIVNGAQFFAIAAKFRPDMLIISNDIQSPSWTEVLDRIKHSSMFQNKLAVAVLTTESSAGLEQQARIYGVLRIIQKPLVFKEFLKMIEDLPI